MPAKPSDDELFTFTGASMQEAYAAAVEMYGTGVEVRRARLVRRGIRGALGQSHYELLVAPPGAGATDTELQAAETAVSVALEELLNEADRAEKFAAERVVAAAGPVSGSRHPDPTIGVHELDEDAPSAIAPRGVWSRARLRELGVPAPILRRLPVEDPQDATGWLEALTKAINAEIPAPASADADHPVVINGYGREGALAMMQAGVVGIAPGTLCVNGRTVLGSPAELAKVVSTCV